MNPERKSYTTAPMSRRALLQEIKGVVLRTALSQVRIKRVQEKKEK